MPFCPCLAQSIDTDKEEINLACRDNVAVTGLASLVPRDRPRYHLFLFPHSHEGEKLRSIGASTVTRPVPYGVLPVSKNGGAYGRVSEGCDCGTVPQRVKQADDGVVCF